MKPIRATGRQYTGLQASLFCLLFHSALVPFIPSLVSATSLSTFQRAGAGLDQWAAEKGWGPEDVNAMGEESDNQ